MTRSWEDNNMLREATTGPSRTRRSSEEMKSVYEEKRLMKKAKDCAESFFYRAYGLLRKIRYEDIDIISCEYEDEDPTMIKEFKFHASMYLGKSKFTGEGMWIGRTFTTAADPNSSTKLTILDYTDEDGERPFRFKSDF